MGEMTEARDIYEAIDTLLEFPARGSELWR